MYVCLYVCITNVNKTFLATGRLDLLLGLEPVSNGSTPGQYIYMYIYIYICIYIYIFIYLFIYTCIYMCVCVFVFICM